MINQWRFDDYFPLNSGFLFSRKALAPSFISSVAKHSAKAVSSSSNPFIDGLNSALTVAMHLATASGALEFIVCNIEFAEFNNSPGEDMWFIRPYCRPRWHQ